MLALKKITKRLLRGKYHELNSLDKKLQQFVDYENGYLVELGANDGVPQSNSLYFEKYRGWRGVLVEPAPQNFLKCRQNRSGRSSIFSPACVSFDYYPEFVRIDYSILMSTPISLESDSQDTRVHACLGDRFLGQNETVFEFGAVARPFNSLLQDAGVPRQIDFLSLDVEGAGLEVLKDVGHDPFQFKFILVECHDLTKMNAYVVVIERVIH